MQISAFFYGIFFNTFHKIAFTFLLNLFLGVLLWTTSGEQQKTPRVNTEN